MKQKKDFSKEGSAKDFARKVNGKIIKGEEGQAKYTVEYEPRQRAFINGKEQPQFRPKGSEWNDYAWASDDF